MSSRKEHIKKSLGITEYPWSSDDDDSQQPVPDVHLLRRQSTEPRPSVADMPGTSGQQLPSSPTSSPGKRSQAEMFWSLMNPSHKSSVGITRSRHFEASTRSPVNSPAPELREARTQRPAAVTDLQRMIAIKKLTRSLGNLRSSKSSSGVYSLTTGSLSGPSRNPIFTPSISSNLPVVKSFRHNALKRLQACRGSFQSYNGHCSTPGSTTNSGIALEELLAPSSAFTRLIQPPVPVSVESLASTEPIVVIDSPVPEIPEVDADNPDHPVDQPTRDENVRCDQETIEVVDTSHNTSGSGVSLEEEIVEIDAHDDTDGNANGDSAAENSVVNTDVSLNEAQILTTTPNEEAEALQQQNHENNKRRRDENISPDDAEPYTVKEFNQSLLRLLECPVCLEWMEPPMSQCRRGHLVCGRCRARLASCPVCRTTFSSVRNRAMEGVAEMVRYPCRHGCGREVRLRRRGAHEASCGARRYVCPAPACAHRPPLPRDHLAHHFQSKHMPMLKIGRKHKFSMKVNSEQHDTWVVAALHEYFSLRVDVDIRTWGVVVYVAYIGPKCNAKNFIYEVSVVGQHNSRKLVYTRATHCDLESSSLNVSRQDCFHLTLDQALNFLRVKNRHCEPDKFLDFNVEISKCENENRDDSDS